MLLSADFAFFSKSIAHSYLRFVSKDGRCRMFVGVLRNDVLTALPVALPGESSGQVTSSSRSHFWKKK